MFGNIGGCAVFTLICFVVKLILFYYHERIWHQIPFGKHMETPWRHPGDTMTDDEVQKFLKIEHASRKLSRAAAHAILLVVLFNLGCMAVSLATVMLVILGCLKLFGLI